MSFWQTIFSRSNLNTVITTTISALTAAFIIYNYMKTQDANETFQEKMTKKITKLRSQINTKNPTSSQFRQLMQIALLSARYEVRKLSHQFSLKRKQFRGEARENKFGQYLDLLYSEIIETDAVAVRELKIVGAKCGVSEIFYKKYENIVEDYLKQIMQGNDQLSEKQLLSLQQTKKAILQKIKFAKQFGKKYVDFIVKNSSNWPIDKKQVLPTIYSMVIADSAFESTPQLDSDIVQQSAVKYQNQLLAELQQLQIAMTPLMLKLNAEIRSTTGYDFADIYQRRIEAVQRPGKQTRQLKEIQKIQMENYENINRMILLNSSSKN